MSHISDDRRLCETFLFILYIFVLKSEYFCFKIRRPRRSPRGLRAPGGGLTTPESLLKPTTHVHLLSWLWGRGQSLPTFDRCRREISSLLDFLRDHSRTQCRTAIPHREDHSDKVLFQGVPNPSFHLT